MSYMFLTIAILTEVVGSSLLKFTQGFKRFIPTVLCLLAYGVAYYTISLSMRDIPLNIAYATWCGVGTILTMLCGALIYKERINKTGFLGSVVLISGIVLLNYCN